MIDLFVVWLKHFVEKIKLTEQRPVLLVLDNHISHQSLEAILYCRRNHIDPLTQLPHLTYLLQPLDLVFFEPLKNLYSSLLNEVMMKQGNNISYIVKLEDVTGIFKQAYKILITQDYVESAFTNTCIWLFSYITFMTKYFPKSKYLAPNQPAQNIDDSKMVDTSSASEKNQIGNNLSSSLPV